MRTGPDFSEEHVLADGTTVFLRHVRPTDAPELRRGFRALSPETRYRRFFHQVGDLSDTALRYLTEVDGVNHVALVAWGYAPDLKTEVGYGLGRFVRIEGEPEVAEAAITVIDPMQHKGVGRILGLALAECALERGIRAFRGEVLTSNTPMRHILEELGGVVRLETPESITIDVALDDPASKTEPTVVRWLRAAANRFAGRYRSAPPPE